MSDTYDASLALELLKVRLNKMHADAPQEDYLRARIDGAAQRLAENGIHLNSTPGDTMLLVDMAAWEYANRDRSGAMPEWLRDVRRNRWLKGEKQHDP